MSSPRDSALSFEAVKASIRQDRNGYSLVLAIHPDDVPEDLMRAWVGARYQVAMVQIGDDGNPVDKPVLIEHKPYKPDPSVALAGMLCREPGFQKWMLTDSEEECAEALCAKLGISSRAELAKNGMADDSLQSLFRQYKADIGILEPSLPE